VTGRRRQPGSLRLRELHELLAVVPALQHADERLRRGLEPWATSSRYFSFPCLSHVASWASPREPLDVVETRNPPSSPA